MHHTPLNSNPFSTRFVKPAANEYLYDDQWHEFGDLDLLMINFDMQEHWGQIIGPHGSGKTTLLHAIERDLVAMNGVVVRYELHDGQRRLPVTSAEMASWPASAVIMIDGYEQLSWLSRRRVKAACRRQECGLLITAHTDLDLPLLCRTFPSESIAQQLVARLMQGHRPVIAPEDVSQQFAVCEGNLREMLFRLYDLYEQRIG